MTPFLLSPDHFVNLVLVAETGSSPVSSSPPSWIQVVLGVLLTGCLTGVFFLLQGERDRRKQAEADKGKSQEQMAAVNQSLTLLLEKHGEVTKDVTEHASRLNALEQRGSAYETSLALLKQAIDIHISTSERDRAQLHRKVDEVRIPSPRVQQ